jgi:hypothetical protein
MGGENSTQYYRREWERILSEIGEERILHDKNKEFCKMAREILHKKGGDNCA